MDEIHYITVDGEPPCGGRPPRQLAAIAQCAAYGALPPYSPPGTYPTPFMIPCIPVVPRREIGTVPGWQPRHGTTTVTAVPLNGPMATTFTPALAAMPPGPPPPEGRPSLPPGANIPTTTNNPLCLPSGMGYIFPTTHTILHIIEVNYLPWDNPLGSFRWRPFQVSVSLTLNELIERVCPPEGSEGRRAVSRGIIECLEVGDGTWLKGSEFWIGDGKGEDDAMQKKVGQTLAKVGWDDKRGLQSRPVWLACCLEFGAN